MTKREGFRYSLIRDYWYREPRCGSIEAVVFCDWFWKYIWPSLVGPQLEAKTKNQKVGSYQPGLDCSGPIAAEVVVWLPGLLIWGRGAGRRDREGGTWQA